MLLSRELKAKIAQKSSRIQLRKKQLTHTHTHLDLVQNTLVLLYLIVRASAYELQSHRPSFGAPEHD